jgi:hypothetical protein
MADVSFERAKGALPAHALGLLETASVEEQAKLAADIKELANDKTTEDAVKSILMGVAVIRVTGPHLLRVAVEGLGPSIRRLPPAL